MKIYIAGKVTGMPIHECTMRFGDAQKMLESKGYQVVNPLEVVNDWQCPWQLAMRKCIEALIWCDAVYLLNNFQESKGAKIELMVAKELQIPIMIQQ